MSMKQDHEGPPSKRRKMQFDPAAATRQTPPSIPEDTADEKKSESLSRPISPPPLSRQRRSRTPTPSAPRVHLQTGGHVTGSTSATDEEERYVSGLTEGKESRCIGSPFRLTRIKDMAARQNGDTVGLGDLLGDPMIRECWNFNFLFDLEFVMNHFDMDVRAMVKVKIVHGFWRNDDERRIHLAESSDNYPNIELISAWMPDPFGTHHSKMLILFRHDDMAQIVIHTANMIPQDWHNMTQAVWQSPLLPLRSTPSSTSDDLNDDTALPIGSGERFKKDIFQYLNAYGKRLKALTEQLVNCDFSTIRAAFIGSAPSRQRPAAAEPSIQTSFGWPGLKQILSTVPIQETASTTPPNLVIQISSIATLGANPTWLKNFQTVLSSIPSNRHSSASPPSSFFTPSSSLPKSPTKNTDPTLKIIFPTAAEIRTSLDGYASGASIHTRLQSPAQQSQLAYLRPLLCHWNSSPSPSVPASLSPPVRPARRQAHRGPAAPHIKTYIRFSDAGRTTIDWAMLTSANLSKQAWGETLNRKGEVWIQSWEVGVVVWPALYGEHGDTVMVPVFGRDVPRGEDVGAGTGEGEGGKTVVGLRMPYDLPLCPYAPEEVPWCASLPDGKPDWMGRVWVGD